MTYQDALELFAKVADDRRRQGRASVLDVSGRAAEWQWEGFRHLGLFYQELYRPADIGDFIEPPSGSERPADMAYRRVVDASQLPNLESAPLSDRKKSHRLDAVDRLRRHEEVLRAGWLWLAGNVTDPETGASRSVCCPLISVPVRMGGIVPMPLNVQTAGDIRFHPLLDARAAAERRFELLPVPMNAGGATVFKSDWARVHPALAAAGRILASEIGFTVDEVAPSTTNPRGRRNQAGLALIAGVAVYVDPHSAVFGTAERLRTWMGAPGVEQSAFHRIYQSPDSVSRDTSSDLMDGPPPRQTRNLNRDQAMVVRLARTEPVIALTGPPGTGKTHALCEVALDAVGQGKSVLIGAKSAFAVEVLSAQLAAVDGPVPVLVGGSQSGNEFASRMSDLLALGTTTEDRIRDTELADVSDTFSRNLRALNDRVSTEQLVQDLASDAERCQRLQQILVKTPGVVDQLSDFVNSGSDGGLLSWWRRRRQIRALGLDRSKPFDDAVVRRRELEAWRRLARANAEQPGAPLHRSDLADSDLHGETIDRELVTTVMTAQDRCWAANARSLRSVMLDRLGSDRQGRQLMQQIATATRISRSERRKVLEQIDAEALAAAVPLWLGTVGDIDDVLPSEPAMFDVVILDEASQIDQPSAAGALLRGATAIVCGDPRQLRHISFVGEEGRSADGSIDVGRDSIFDRAVGAGKLVALREHYRSDPHLIDFSAQRFYDDNLAVATRSPGNDRTDLIDVHVVDGTRTDDGVNQTEIEEVLRLLRNEPISDGGTIGIVSPFRAQADALTDAIIEHVPPSKIERRGIEVGTVHAFQGAEFDTVIASWVLDETSPGRSWTFVNDPSLFNVMITRARRRMVVVSSVAQPPGLAADYVRYAERGLDGLAYDRGGDSSSTGIGANAQAAKWTEDVVSVLIDAGYEVVERYPVGRFTVDAVLRDARGRKGEPIAVCCHPGPDHVERELLLHRMGWQVVYAFRSEWSGRLARLVIELGRDLRRA